ncbi:MAG: prepilin peptidase [Acidimicrobiales bacterium]|nr:prepilin peptidase [Acidimicrobiales bacterium]MCB9371298.1 prepilin peptidase [Microthrixaceae bacterium]
MSDALVVALCAVAGVVVAPFLTTLIEQVPGKLPLRWPGPAEHPPILYWLRPREETASAATDAASRTATGAGADPRDARADVDDAEAAEEGFDGPLPPGWGLATEIASPVLFALAGVRFGASAVVVPFCVLFGALLVVSVIDIGHYRIPDRIVFPTLALSLPLIVAVSLGLGAGRSIGYALVGALAYFLLLLVAHLVYPAGMGFGDVKLALLMGLYLGWIAPDAIRAVTLVLFALMIGCLLGVAVGAVLAVVRRRNAAFPFGPALAASTVAAVLFSQQLLGTG